MTFPRMVKVCQSFEAPKIKDLKSSIKSELRKKNLRIKIQKGARIAITAGSRGIANYPEILAAVVDEMKRLGGSPFIIPAMGSHGGATSKGQKDVLDSLGITPEKVGAPIESSMEVEEIGRLENGAPVYVDRIAIKSDGIIVVGRVKPHTDFKGKIESGLMKMMAIGLGKQKGAEMIHRFQSEGYHKNIPLAAKMIIEKAPILLGLAIIENGNHETSQIKALEPAEIEEEEPKLLKKSKDLMPRIPFKEIDVLVIDEIGKNISGVGMDTNVVGRFWIKGESDPLTPTIRRIVVLDLSEDTHGNAIGIGLSDLTTSRVFEKIDRRSTFVNSLTSGWPEAGKMPVFLPNDHDAIATALRICGPINPNMARIVRIRNTLELKEFWISESLQNQVKSDNNLSSKITFLEELREMQFDVLGNLAR